jgi:hypothetical protein
MRLQALLGAAAFLYRRCLFSLGILVLVGYGQDINDHLNTGNAVTNDFSALNQQ